jgi:GTP 3',8-cyclase
VNEGEVLPLAHWAKTAGVDLRYIEYMDVGETNGWKYDEVVSGAEILSILSKEFPLTPRDPAYRGEVAVHWRHDDGMGEIGVIQSVTKPFCRDCQRLRLSADGKIFTCLFAADGHDLRGILRSGMSPKMLGETVRSIWQVRADRYSEVRGEIAMPKAEMSYLGG